MKWLKTIKNFLKKLFQPQITIAGLEINDIAIRIAQFKGNLLNRAAVILGPGVIENGRIKDRTLFNQNLKKLYDQFGGSDEKIPVIVSIPSVNIYSKIFSIPPLSGKNFEGAVRLNLEGISPADIKLSYTDAEIVSREEGGKIEVLGAFVLSEIVDDYIEALKETNFVPVVVEFPALALARAIKEFGVNVEVEKSQVVLNVASDGINLMIVKQGNLYFDYFVPWKLIHEEGRTIREIPFDDFKQTIIRELQKVSTFYRGHWNGELNQLILITQALNSEIIGIIKENFSFQIIELKLREFTDLPTSWFGVLGSALRGKIFRSKDFKISLMKVGTEEGCRQSENLFFIKLWRNVLLTTLSFLVLAFIFVNFFLKYLSDDLNQQSQKLLKIPEGTEIIELQKQANLFNQLTDKLFIAKEQSIPWSPFFIKLNSLLKNNIVLTRISVNSLQSSVLLNGDGRDETSVVDFKNELIKLGFQDVNLPLSGMKILKDGKVSFAITFKLLPGLH